MSSCSNVCTWTFCLLISLHLLLVMCSSISSGLQKHRLRLLGETIDISSELVCCQVMRGYFRKFDHEKLCWKENKLMSIFIGRRKIWSDLCRISAVPIDASQGAGAANSGGCQSSFWLLSTSQDVFLFWGDTVIFHGELRWIPSRVSQYIMMMVMLLLLI